MVVRRCNNCNNIVSLDQTLPCPHCNSNMGFRLIHAENETMEIRENALGVRESRHWKITKKSGSILAGLGFFISAMIINSIDHSLSFFFSILLGIYGVAIQPIKEFTLIIKKDYFKS